MSETYLCENTECGNKLPGKGKWCSYCNTHEKREAQRKENETIKQNRLNKQK